MATKPSMVFLLVDTPDHSAAVQKGQEPTNIACYRCAIQGSETVEAAMERCRVVNQLPIGSTVWTTTDARCDGPFTVQSSMVPAK